MCNQDEKINTIIVTLMDGIVYVHGDIPKGCQVEVHDYDVYPDEEDPEDVRMGEDGNRFLMSVYYGE
jgi:hypothetical protein